MLYNIQVAILLAVSISAVIVVTFGYVFRRSRASRNTSARRLSPEMIARYVGDERRELAPEELSRSIVERSERIQLTLLQVPSEVEVDMCALGYRACVEDMITLTHQIGQETEHAGPLRRARLRTARRRATESLYRLRQTLPPGALNETHQQQ